MTAVRVILHGKAAGDARVRTAVHALRREGHLAEVRVTWEPRDATRLTAEAAAEAAKGKIDCIVAGGGDGTINEVFAAAYAAGLPTHCSLGVLPLWHRQRFCSFGRGVGQEYYRRLAHRRQRTASID